MSLNLVPSTIDSEPLIFPKINLILSPFKWVKDNVQHKELCFPQRQP